jgi:hypothetical protein
MPKNNSLPKTPIIIPHHTSVPAYSIFNPNEWVGDSKPVITSCAAQYNLRVEKVGEATRKGNLGPF